MTAWNDALALGLLMIGVLLLWVGWVAWSFRERDSEPAAQRQASGRQPGDPSRSGEQV